MLAAPIYPASSGGASFGGGTGPKGGLERETITETTGNGGCQEVDQDC